MAVREFGLAGGLRRWLPALIASAISIALATLVLRVAAEGRTSAASMGLAALALLLSLFLAVIAQRERSHRVASEAHRRAEEQLGRTQLSGGGAHDLNNVLGVIIGNLDLLLESRDDDPEVRELAGEARNAALRCVVPISSGANEQPALPLRPRSRLPPSRDR
jgi:signal transduction histidine kinase